MADQVLCNAKYSAEGPKVKSSWYRAGRGRVVLEWRSMEGLLAGRRPNLRIEFDGPEGAIPLATERLRRVVERKVVRRLKR